MKKAVLVTGGAGYIGSHTTLALAAEDFHVVILDDFSQKQLVNMPWATMIHGDFADVGLLSSIFKQYDIQAVFHFAAFIEVGESVKRPRSFYDNNVSKTATLLATMLDHHIHRFIFSSSCAVYGAPQYVPMDEQHPTAPVSPYGRTKLAVEFMLQDYAQAYGLGYASLRYFNASGAQWEHGLGEQHTPETHLIPLLIDALVQGREVYVFGDDYATPDGTCVRDYIHVRDLAQAHVRAFKRLMDKQEALVINIGTGIGHSVQEVIAVAQRVCGRVANVRLMPRRAGDAPVLVSHTQHMQKLFNWHPEHSDLTTIVTSAYVWYQQRRQEKSTAHMTL